MSRLCRRYVPRCCALLAITVLVALAVPGWSASEKALQDLAGPLRALALAATQGGIAGQAFPLLKGPEQDVQVVILFQSPYAAAKVYSYWMVKNYREGYNMFACNGILFNHESPRRGETFVTRKITRALARIKYGLQNKLFLGNLEAKRDWGYAPDYVGAMWIMLQQDKPDDFVIATGESHSVKEFLDEAFSYAELDWKKYVEIDPRYFRPTEVAFLKGDANKAKTLLNWRPKTTFKELVKIMVDADIKALENMKQCHDIIHKLSNNNI